MRQPKLLREMPVAGRRRRAAEYARTWRCLGDVPSAVRNKILKEAYNRLYGPLEKE